MKKIIGILLLLGNFCFAQSQFPQDVYDNIILSDAKKASKSANEMLEAIKNNGNLAQKFQILALDWKRVQAVYIAGELNENGLDLPYEIDNFHNMKENIAEQLDRIISGNEDVEKAMFKNSHKSINALEYLIFKQKLKPARENAMAAVAAKSIAQKLAKIVSIYEASRNAALSDENKFNAMILNQLVASSYELKEWRLGEATGLAKKYSGIQDKKKAELYISNLSVPAIEAILDTHGRIMDSPQLFDFGDYAAKAGAKNEVTAIRKSISAAKKHAKAVNGNILAAGSKLLYVDLSRLHTGYYVSLMGALQMTSKILDADGD